MNQSRRASLHSLKAVLGRALPLRARPRRAQASACELTRRALRGPSERGFALLTVLWLITALATLVGLGLASTRLGTLTTRNRLLLTRGRWAAEACLAIADAHWAAGRLTDTASVDLGRGTWCAWRVEDPGARINVNTTERVVLDRLACDTPGTATREVSCSVAVDRVIEARKRAPFVALDQVAALTGLESLARAYLTVDGSGTVNVNAASPAVVRALPGMSPEAVQLVSYRRLVSRAVGSLDELAGALSPSAREALLAHYAELAAVVRFTPDRLRITAEGWVAGQVAGRRPRATIEVLVVPLPDRLAVVRRRMW